MPIVESTKMMREKVLPEERRSMCIHTHDSQNTPQQNGLSYSITSNLAACIVKFAA